jgi:hypothetical protein
VGRGWIAPVAAAVLAAVLGLIELASARKKPLSFRALHWLVLRLLIDGATAALAYAVLVSAFEGLKWFRGAWPVVVAGLAGPALLRSQLSLIGSGEESRAYGPANVHRRVQRLVDHAIDDIGSVAQSRWIHRKVLPAISGTSLNEIRNRTEVYLKSLDRLTTAQYTKHMDFIDATVAEAGTSEDAKRRAVVQRLLDSGSQRFVRSLMKECRR